MEAQLTSERLDRYFQQLKDAPPQGPDIEYISAREYARRRARHTKEGVPMDIPSWMEWPLR